MTTTIIQRISTACSCNEQEAQEYLNDELRHLREMRDLGDLRNSDFESACSGLGLDFDFIAYFIEAVAC